MFKRIEGVMMMQPKPSSQSQVVFIVTPFPLTGIAYGGVGLYLIFTVKGAGIF